MPSGPTSETRSDDLLHRVGRPDHQLVEHAPLGGAPLEVRRGAQVLVQQVAARQHLREEGPVAAEIRHQAAEGANEEFPYQPARVLLQDFTGVPCIADLAALRSAMQRAGKDPGPDRTADPGRPRDRPLRAGRHLRGRRFAAKQRRIEFERNSERYVFLRWGQGAFRSCASCRPASASATRSTSSTSRRAS
jgi:aconitase A